MCLANLVKNLSSVQGKKWLSNIMTQSLDERQVDTQLDWVCCSCVFGKLKLHPSFPVFSPWSLFVFSYVLQNCFIASSLSTLFFKPPPPCWFLLMVSRHLSISLSHSFLHSPPTLSFDEVLWGLCCWLLPSLLYNNPIRLPESLLG